MGIQGRLLLGYFLVIVILIAAGGLIIQRMGDELEATVGRDAQTVAAALLDELDLAMEGRIHSIRLVAGTSRPLQDALAASNLAFAARGTEDEIRAGIDAQDRAWREASQDADSPFMRDLMSNDVSALLRQTMEFLRRSEGRPVFAEIFVTNRYGANAGQTGRTSDYRQDDEDWWQAAWEEGTWVSQEITFDESAGVHSVDIALRVDDAAGEPLGVAKAVLNASVLRRIIDGFAAATRSAGAFVELLDHAGHLVHRQGEAASFGEDLAGQAAVQRALAGEHGALVETTGRGELLRAFRRSSEEPGAIGFGWILILNHPTERVYASVTELKRWMLAVGIGGAVAALIVGLLLAQAFGGVTRRLQSTAAALKRSEGHTRAIVSGVADGIVTIDSQARIKTVNPATRELFGYEDEEMIGRNVKFLMPEPYHTEHDGYVASYLETGVARIIGQEREVEGRRKDGTTFPLDLRVSELYEQGERQFVGILRDVTERVAANRALEEAKEAAVTASRSKGQFLANMSHELRTPLNAIIGYSEMVSEELAERGDKALVDDIERVRSSGKHLLGLINDILDVSKIEAGHMDTHLEVFDLREFLESVTSTVRPLMATNQNTLELDAPDDLGHAHTDVTKLRQILFNLLSNAAKFTHEGTVDLWVRREPEGWLSLRVSDTGIGMDAGQLERVWDAFAQADASTTRQFGGTGLGLTITRSFCEILGGSIDVSSRKGEGTSFLVRLPVPVPLPEAATAGVEKTPAAASTDTVLVIDDDPAARDLVRRFLAKEGIDVVGAPNGTEGLRLAAEILPSAIVLDVMMPGMDGWTVLSTLKGDPALAAIPVVMLTMVDERQLGLTLGVDDYLTKPVDRARLRDALAPFCLDPRDHTALVVDDEPDALELVARALRGRGWTVVEARNGREALARLAENDVDIILTDLMMPDVDGFELVDTLRRDERWRDVPVVVLTSKDLSAEDGARLEGAAQQLIAKGAYSREALLAEMGRLVRLALLRGHAQEAPGEPPAAE